MDRIKAVVLELSLEVPQYLLLFAEKDIHPLTNIVFYERDMMIVAYAAIP